MKYLSKLFVLTAAIVTSVTIAATAQADLSDERQILNTINNVGYFADRNQWPQVAEQFHPKGAVLDYTSYQNASAGTSKELPKLLPQQIVDAWQTVLPGYDTTHHLMGTQSVMIEGDTAQVTSNIYATHILSNTKEVTVKGESFWVFIGDYQHTLKKTVNGWKITFMRANMRNQLGNPKLPQLATEVVKARKAAQ